MKKIFAMFLVVMILIVSQVNMFAANEEIEHNHNDECCSYVDIDDNEKMSKGIGCMLGFHSVETVYRSIGMSCIDFGDSICYYNCYEITRCSKCNEQFTEVVIHQHFQCHRSGGCYPFYV